MLRHLLFFPLLLSLVQCLPFGGNSKPGTVTLKRLADEDLYFSALYHAGRDPFPTRGRNIELEELGKIRLGYGRFGDLLLPIHNNGTLSKNAIAYDSMRWSKGVVPYVIDSSAEHLSVGIGMAMQQYKANTCITFVPRTIERNYLKIFAGRGCYSYVGMINQGQQELCLGRGCYPIGTIVHELGHAIGFFHEQNRSNRDDYLTINWQNIQNGKADQFAKLLPSQNRMFTPFDYNSIMLYGDRAFSRDGRSKTMVSRTGVQLREVYNKPGLSRDDISRINHLYKCPPPPTR